MRQLTERESLELYNSGTLEEWPPDRLAWFQINQKRLCVRWIVFIDALEHVLNREVSTIILSINRDDFIEQVKRQVNHDVLSDIVIRAVTCYFSDNQAAS